MKLKDAPVGSVAIMYVNGRTGICSQASISTGTMKARVCLHKAYDTLLGWRKGEECEPGAGDHVDKAALVAYQCDVGFHIMSTWEIYGYDIPPDATLTALTVVPSCQRCGNFYPFAQPNRSNGTLVCWSCRQGWLPPELR